MTLALAVFDVDHTLVKGSSGGVLITYLWRRNVLSQRHKRMMLREMFAYRAGRRSGRKLVELGARAFDGLSEAELREHGRRCAEEQVKKLIYREALDEIERCRMRGLTVVLASGSTNLVIEPLAKLVGADLGIGSRAEVRDGLLTAEVIQPIPYQSGKVELVERAYAGRDIDWRSSTAYSDRAIDVPLLERVGRPIAVNPRGSLRGVALERGWRIERWRRVLGDSR